MPAGPRRRAPGTDPRKGGHSHTGRQVSTWRLNWAAMGIGIGKRLKLQRHPRQVTEPVSRRMRRRPASATLGAGFSCATGGQEARPRAASRAATRCEREPHMEATAPDWHASTSQVTTREGPGAGTETALHG
jgi:hypothetical protein